MDIKRIIRKNYIYGCIAELASSILFIYIRGFDNFTLKSEFGITTILLDSIGILLIVKELLIPYIIIEGNSLKKYDWYKYVDINIDEVKITFDDEIELDFVELKNDNAYTTIYFYGLSNSDKNWLLKLLNEKSLMNFNKIRN